MSDMDNEVLTQDPLAAMKARADMLGVKYHPSISLEKLREKVNAALADQESPVDDDDDAPAEAPTAPAPVVRQETEGERRKRKKLEAAELIRIRVTCMNPAKKEWDGEIFTAGNSVVGSFTKYVPFNADEGWHVPRIIYKQMLQRQCQVFTTVTDHRGNKSRKGKLIKEFAIEVLPQLTKEELEELARRQAMAKSID